MVLYEDNAGLVRLQEVLKEDSFSVSLKQLSTGTDHRSVPSWVRRVAVPLWQYAAV